MRMLNLICAGVALVGLVVSVTLWRELRAQREVMAEWQDAHPEAVSRSASMSSTATATSKGSPPQVAVPGLRPNPVVPTTNQSEQMVASQGLLQDPDSRGRALSNLKQILPHAYSGLVEELGLSPDEAGRLFDLLAEQQLEIASLMGPATEGVQRDSAYRQDVGLRGLELQRKHDLSLAALLGDSRHAKLKEYQESRRARQQVAQYGGTMGAMGHPLSAEQEVSLRGVLLAEDRRQRTEVENMLRSTRRTGTLDVAQAVEEARRRRADSHARIIAAAQPHLNAQQLESLRSSLDQQLAASRVSVRPR
jgi:hypothetical protein